MCILNNIFNVTTRYHNISLYVRLIFKATVYPSSVTLQCTYRCTALYNRPPQWRRGSGLDFGSEDPGSNTPLTLTACGPSDGKEVKDVFGRPVARVEVGSAR